MDFLSIINNVANDIMASGLVRLVYFAIVIVCLVLLVQSKAEDFWAWDGGATQRHFSELTSTNQGGDPKESNREGAFFDIYSPGNLVY